MEGNLNMNKETITPYIFYLTRGKIFVFQQNLKNVLEIPIPDTVVRDLEIKKISELENLIATSVRQNNLPVGPAYLILASNVVLEKVMPNLPGDKSKTFVEDHVKLAPFNHVGFEIVATGKENYLVLVNRELFEGVQEILERLGFHVSAVTPTRSLGIAPETFTAQVGNEILRKTQLVFQNSFISDPDRVAQAENNLSSDPRRNKKLLLLLLAFGILILVLGGLVVKMTFFGDKPQAATSQPKIRPTGGPASTQVPVQQVSPAPSASPSASIKDLKVQVLNASGQTGLAQSTKDLLVSSGFGNVETGNASTISGDRIQIVFSPSVPTQARETIIKALGSKFPNPATRDGENPDGFAIVVTLTDSGQSGT